ELVASLRERLRDVEASVGGRSRPRVAVLEWTDPPFLSGHWVPDMVEAAGASSALGESGKRSARTDWDSLARANADVIVIAPCGYHLDAAAELAHDVLAAHVL